MIYNRAAGGGRYLHDLLHVVSDGGRGQLTSRESTTKEELKNSEKKKAMKKAEKEKRNNSDRDNCFKFA